MKYLENLKIIKMSENAEAIKITLKKLFYLTFYSFKSSTFSFSHPQESSNPLLLSLLFFSFLS